MPEQAQPSATADADPTDDGTEAATPAQRRRARTTRSRTGSRHAEPARTTLTLTIPHPRVLLARLLTPPPPSLTPDGTTTSDTTGTPPQPALTGPAAALFGRNGLPRAATVVVTVLVVLALALTAGHPRTTPSPAADQGRPGINAPTPDASDAPAGLDPATADPGGASLAVAVTASPATGTPVTSPTAQAVTLPAAAPSAPLPATPTIGQSAAPQQLSTSGIPARAKLAYTAAAARMAALAPTCRLPWTLLGAIGRVESNHARTGRSTLTASTGRAHPAIYGIRLNGTTPGTAVIRDTDHGTLDADPSYDRAVGPMQFLPATWRAVALDADGDRVADPQDLDDAALTAARYLCTGASTDLSTAQGQWNAAYRYNRSTSYAGLVLALSTTYATGRPATVVTPPPGATTAIPTVTLTITPAPAITKTLTPTPTASTAPSASPTGASTTTPGAGPPPAGSTVTVTVTVITVTVTPGGTTTSTTTTSTGP